MGEHTLRYCRLKITVTEISPRQRKVAKLVHELATGLMKKENKEREKEKEKKTQT